MANKYEKQTRGISKSAGSFDKEEVVKSKWKRLGEWSTRPKNACNTLVVMAFLCYLGAMIGASIYLVPIAWMLYRYFLRQPERAPLKIPMQEKILDLNQLHSGKRVPEKGQGIFFLGKSIDADYSGKEIWLTNDDTRQHFLILGTTGAGKTELLMAFAANALSWGSGLIFVDGKGDIKLMGAMYALVKRWGRDADFLLLNFMPLPNANALVPGETISNSMNPYVTADADDIKQQIVGLMPEGGGDGMWKDRAMTMLEAEVMCLTWCRDNGVLDMSLSSLRQYILLDNLSKFADPEQFPGMPEKYRENIRLYLSSLGNYDFSKKGGEQESDVAKQHSYLEMQLSGPFAALANQYGAIFDTDFGEVDMFDVVLNRRILVCLLPSLQKSAEDVERMGKIIVASLKSMMGATLGNLGLTADPTVLSLLKVRVTAAPYPFLVILDEVGYYTVSGMAMMAAQVRSLGFSMIYAAQDLKAMTRNNEKEAQSIIANTNVKIVMRTEDSDTMELAVKAGGQAARIKATGYKPSDDTPIFGGGEWNENLDYAISFENRINELDLKSQDEGFMTVLYKDIIVRGRSFYVATLDTYADQDMVSLSPNQFLTVRKPDAQAFESSRQIPKILIKMKDAGLRDKQAEITEKVRAEKSDTNIIGKIFDAAAATSRMSKRDLKSISCVALGGLSVISKGEKEAMVDIVKNSRKPQPLQSALDAEFVGDEEETTGIPKPETSAPPATQAKTSPPPQKAQIETKTAPVPVTKDEPETNPIDVDGLMDKDVPKTISGIEINNDGTKEDLESDISSSETIEKVIASVATRVSFTQAEDYSEEDKKSIAASVDAGINDTLGVSGEEDISSEALQINTRDLGGEPSGDDMGWGDISDAAQPELPDGYEDIEEPEEYPDIEGEKATESETDSTTAATETGNSAGGGQGNIEDLTGDSNLDKVKSDGESDDIIDLTGFLNNVTSS